MRHLPAVLAGFVGLLLISVAAASNIPRKNADVATVTRFCTGNGYVSPQGGPMVGLQCNEPVLILTGKKLSDGGTRATVDAGEPISPDTNCERVIFPGDVLQIPLAPGENCVGVVSADAGTNKCNFFDVAGQ